MFHAVPAWPHDILKTQFRHDIYLYKRLLQPRTRTLQRSKASPPTHVSAHKHTSYPCVPPGALLATNHCHVPAHNVLTADAFIRIVMSPGALLATKARLGELSGVEGLWRAARDELGRLDKENGELKEMVSAGIDTLGRSRCAGAHIGKVAVITGA